MLPNLDAPNGGPIPGPWRSPSGLPEDPALPALGAIRTMGLAEVLPELALTGSAVELRPCTYRAGSRATFEARAGHHRFAIKLYAEDASLEADLYRRLARIGFAKEYGARVPRLLAWDADLRLLVLSWFDGPTAQQLVMEGNGARAGQLAASWLWHASRRRLRFGPQRGRPHMLYQAGLAAGALSVASLSLGTAAKAVAKTLVQQKIRERRPNLVHATFYARHIFDLGDGPGVIDWMQFGQGPVEVDAGMFLATISRIALRHESAARDAQRAKEVFLDRTQRLVDPRAVEWHWAAGLLHLAASGLRTGRRNEPSPGAKAIVEEAAMHARLAAEGASVPPAGTRKSFWRGGFLSLRSGGKL